MHRQCAKTTRWPPGTTTRAAIVLAIQRQPGTNTVEVVDGIKRSAARRSAIRCPHRSTCTILYDRSESIRESVADVKFTLLLTIGLVVLVIFLFLRNLSGDRIPSLALPMSIIGTFAVMYLLGYSVDNLSLMALTLSVGFVVDDAIVMLENIVRHMEMGEPPMQAALNGSREIGFTIISMTLSLAAVFIPVLFMGGIVGRPAARILPSPSPSAILISGVVSLTLTPMMCSRFVHPPGERRHGRLYVLIGRFFQRHAPGIRMEPAACAAPSGSRDRRGRHRHGRHGLSARHHPEGVFAQRGYGQHLWHSPKPPRASRSMP